MFLPQIFIPLFLLFQQVVNPAYQREVEDWRREREAQLKADGGWLSVAGLFWLKEGPNTIGSDPGSDIRLPEGSAPAHVGQFILEQKAIRIEQVPGGKATLNDRPFVNVVMETDSSGTPDVLRIHGLAMTALRRGGRIGIRLKDANNPARRNFPGLRYYPIRERFRVKARYKPYDPPKRIKITDVLGETSEDISPGYVEFVLEGKRCRLDPLLEGDELFFIFKDKTAGHGTYPAGRFLYAGLPKAGEVILDFNKAMNPPCAFTPHATCPLPPRQNHIPVRIEAGELRYSHEGLTIPITAE